MMHLTRLNHDTAWLLEIDGTRLALDPWIDGPAIVGLPVVHQAHLPEPGWPLPAWAPVDAVVLSHPYPDHAQATTLRALPRDTPVLAPPISAWFAWWHARFGDVRPIRGAGLAGGAAEVGRVRVSYARGGWFDPTHNVLLFQGLDSGESLLYAPHGMVLGGVGERRIRAALGERPLDALLCSFTHLDLPGYLGGVANLGEEAAAGLVAAFAPRWVGSTHDGDKPDTGFIASRATITRCRAIPDRVGAAFAGARTLEGVTGERLAL